MSDHATRWIIRRNCSASPKQLALVFASIVLLSFAIGVAFAAHGLWMVLPFVGLELLAVALAFIFYGRHAADYERIELRDGWIDVEHVEGPRRRRWRVPAPWVRLEVQPAGPGERGRARVHLTARGERVEIGRHLLDARRLALAAELKRALAEPAAAA
jgi:uncharacterized membrane protein